MPTRMLLLVGALVVACGCGKSSNPTAPTPTTVNSLSISPATDMITIKGAETFTTLAVYSNGTSATVQSTWSSDAPAVATVEASTGRATGTGAGQATISAEYQAVRATRLLRVVPDYKGQWQGDWVVAACTADGDWLAGDACRAIYPVGSIWLIALVADQNRDAVSGTIDFGDNMPGPVTGTIAMNGHLAVSGTYSMVIEGVSVEVTVSNWDTVSTDSQSMSGHFRLTLRAALMNGSVNLDGDLRVVGKGGGQSMTASTGAAVGHALRRTIKRR